MHVSLVASYHTAIYMYVRIKRCATCRKFYCRWCASLLKLFLIWDLARISPGVKKPVTLEANFNAKYVYVCTYACSWHELRRERDYLSINCTLRHSILCGGKNLRTYMYILHSYSHRGVPRIERGGVRVAIGGAVHRLGSVVIHSTFGVHMCMLYLGGVRAL